MDPPVSGTAGVGGVLRGVCVTDSKSVTDAEVTSQFCVVWFPHDRISYGDACFGCRVTFWERFTRPSCFGRTKHEQLP